MQAPTTSPSTTATSAAPVETTAAGAPDFAAQVDLWQAEHDVVGAVVLVVDSAGTEESVAVGFADRQNAIRIQDEDLFRLGSITKIYTAALVLTLVEDGILSLGGSASDYLPNLPDAITVGQLLSHTAGLRDVDVAAGIFEAIEAGGLPEGSGDPVSDALDRGLAYDPGTRQSYSSIGYLAIERIIEGAVGASWEAALSDLLTDQYPSTKLEDASTSLPTPYERLGTASPAISLAGLPTSEFARGAGAAGGLVATASDVAQFVRALFGGEIVDGQSLTEMMDVTSPRTCVRARLGLLRHRHQPGLWPQRSDDRFRIERPPRSSQQHHRGGAFERRCGAHR